MQETQEEYPEPIRKFIITDPSSIMTESEYEEKILQITKYSRRDIETKTPFNSLYTKTGDLITIYKIQVTNNGDGSHRFREQEIGVDSGLLCIAENRKGWNEQFGALLETLTEARIVFPHIIKNF